jgi:hypothetical protein
MLSNEMLPDDEVVYCEDCARPVYDDERTCRDCQISETYDRWKADREDRACGVKP